MDAQMDLKYAVNWHFTFSHNVCLPLKTKLGFNDKLIGLFQKKKKKSADGLGWA